MFPTPSKLRPIVALMGGRSTAGGRVPSLRLGAAERPSTSAVLAAEARVSNGGPAEPALPSSARLSAAKRQSEHVLRGHPAVITLIPLDDNVAVIGSLARSAEARPKCVTCDRAHDCRTGALVEYCIAYVYPLYDLSVAHRSVSVGRRNGKACNTRAVESRSVPDPLEAQADSGTDGGPINGWRAGAVPAPWRC